MSIRAFAIAPWFLVVALVAPTASACHPDLPVFAGVVLADGEPQPAFAHLAWGCTGDDWLRVVRDTPQGAVDEWFPVEVSVAGVPESDCLHRSCDVVPLLASVTITNADLGIRLDGANPTVAHYGRTVALVGTVPAGVGAFVETTP